MRLSPLALCTTLLAGLTAQDPTVPTWRELLTAPEWSAELHQRLVIAPGLDTLHELHALQQDPDRNLRLRATFALRWILHRYHPAIAPTADSVLVALQDDAHGPLLTLLRQVAPGRFPTPLTAANAMLQFPKDPAAELLARYESAADPAAALQELAAALRSEDPILATAAANAANRWLGKQPAAAIRAGIAELALAQVHRDPTLLRRGLHNFDDLPVRGRLGPATAIAALLETLATGGEPLVVAALLERLPAPDQATLADPHHGFLLATLVRATGSLDAKGLDALAAVLSQLTAAPTDAQELTAMREVLAAERQLRANPGSLAAWRARPALVLDAVARGAVAPLDALATMPEGTGLSLPELASLLPASPALPVAVAERMSRTIRDAPAANQDADREALTHLGRGPWPLPEAAARRAAELGEAGRRLAAELLAPWHRGQHVDPRLPTALAIELGLPPPELAETIAEIQRQPDLAYLADALAITFLNLDPSSASIASRRFVVATIRRDLPIVIWRALFTDLLDAELLRCLQAHPSVMNRTALLTLASERRGSAILAVAAAASTTATDPAERLAAYRAVANFDGSTSPAAWLVHEAEFDPAPEVRALAPGQR